MMGLLNLSDRTGQPAFEHFRRLGGADVRSQPEELGVDRMTFPTRLTGLIYSRRHALTHPSGLGKRVRRSAR